MPLENGSTAGVIRFRAWRKATYGSSTRIKTRACRFRYSSTSSEREMSTADACVVARYFRYFGFARKVRHPGTASSIFAIRSRAPGHLRICTLNIAAEPFRNFCNGHHYFVTGGAGAGFAGGGFVVEPGVVCPGCKDAGIPAVNFARIFCVRSYFSFVYIRRISLLLSKT